VTLNNCVDSRRSGGRAPLTPTVKHDDELQDELKPPEDEKEIEGALRAMARRNQLLPWSWDHLTPTDLAEVRDLLWFQPSSATCIDREAAFAIAAMLTTGRKLAVLSGLSAYDTEQDMKDAGASIGLIRGGGSPFWCLNAGSPRSQQSRRRRSKGLERYKGELPIYFHLPLAPVAAARFASLPASIPGPNCALFGSDEMALRPAIKQLLKLRRAGPVPPRRSSTTVECLERYLAVAITHQSRGDIGAAARFTDSDEVMSRSVIHYGVTHLRSTMWRAREATLILDRRRHSGFLSGCPNHIGSVRAPSWTNVRELVQWLKAQLQTGDATTHERHLAMTCYTVALLCFALGHRGLGYSLPGSAAVDRSTNFCKVHEKAKADARESRMIWVAPVAVSQMRAYEEHLRSLKHHLGEEAFSELEGQLAAGVLPLFTFAHGKTTRLSIKRVWKWINEQLPTTSGDFYFHENSGRHWLRSELEGMCASETLHAFFGHSQSGTDPWSLGSCFDPLIYRADLETRLDGLLKRADWLARKAPGAVS
jgi:hypothetical protein